MWNCVSEVRFQLYWINEVKYYTFLLQLEIFGIAYEFYIRKVKNLKRGYINKKLLFLLYYFINTNFIVHKLREILLYVNLK